MGRGIRLGLTQWLYLEAGVRLGPLLKLAPCGTRRQLALGQQLLERLARLVAQRHAALSILRRRKGGWPTHTCWRRATRVASSSLGAAC
jgi:hypothetical protein